MHMMSSNHSNLAYFENGEAVAAALLLLSVEEGRRDFLYAMAYSP